MKHENIISEIDAYCAKTGLAPSTVCVLATNNSRFYVRQMRREEKLKSDAEKIRAWMRNHPPESE